MHIVEEKSKQQFSIPGLGSRLRELRKSIGASSLVISKRSGIRQNSILVWEREEEQRTIRLEKLKAIVEALHSLGVEHPVHRSKQRGHLLEYLIWGE